MEFFEGGLKIQDVHKKRQETVRRTYFFRNIDTALWNRINMNGNNPNYYIRK